MSENSIKSESHIDAIVRQEEEALERRSSSERLVDGVGAFAGSLVFVVLHLVFLIGWLLVNSGKIPTARPFDPYPSLPFAAACLVARNFYPILCMPTVYQRFTIGRCGAHFLATFCNLSVRADAI
jgi:hypothetical protein